MTTKKVLYFLAAATPTGTELTEIGRLALDANITLGVRSVLFVDTQTGNVAGTQFAETTETLEACDGVAGTYPTVAGGYTNNYDALITATTVKDYSAEAKGGAARLSIFAPAGVSFTHTGTLQLAAIMEGPDGTMSDVSKTVAWVSGTPATATVGAATGLVTGVAAGTTLITATQTTSGKTVTATVTITAT